VRRVVAHPSSRIVATCSSDKTARLWSLGSADASSLSAAVGGAVEFRGHEHVCAQPVCNALCIGPWGVFICLLFYALGDVFICLFIICF